MKNTNSDACTAEEAFDAKGIILKHIDKVPGIRYRTTQINWFELWSA